MLVECYTPSMLVKCYTEGEVNKARGHQVYIHTSVSYHDDCLGCHAASFCAHHCIYTYMHNNHL